MLAPISQETMVFVTRMNELKTDGPRIGARF
jgi:hypothetical protein